MYGNTEAAAEVLAAKLAEKGVLNTRLYDVSSTNVSYLISDLFKYSHLVLASVTYNLRVFPPMQSFLDDMAVLFQAGGKAVAVREQLLGDLKDGEIGIPFLIGFDEVAVFGPAGGVQHEISPYIIEIREDIHRHPEASLQETRTTDLIAAKLEEDGIPYRRLNPTGIVAEIQGDFPGKTVALRADIDALSVTEKTDVPFRSENPGFMHACSALLAKWW